MDSHSLFSVIDTHTGKEPDTYAIALNEEWAKDLLYMDIDGFVMDEYGTLGLCDDCGNVRWCPEGRFTVVWGDTQPMTAVTVGGVK